MDVRRSRCASACAGAGGKLFTLTSFLPILLSRLLQAVYLFRSSDGFFINKAIASDGGYFAQFGSALAALTSEHVIVGAYQHEPGSIDGKVYLMRINSVTGNLEEMDSANNPDPGMSDKYVALWILWMETFFFCCCLLVSMRWCGVEPGHLRS